MGVASALGRSVGAALGEAGGLEHAPTRRSVRPARREMMENLSFIGGYPDSGLTASSYAARRPGLAPILAPARRQARRPCLFARQPGQHQRVVRQHMDSVEWHTGHHALPPIRIPRVVSRTMERNSATSTQETHRFPGYLTQ